MASPLVVVLNGPNLNRLGTREPAVYGTETLADIETACRRAAEARGLALSFRQTNHEGALVDFIHEAADTPGLAGLAINAGALTHTSVALHDALRLLPVPVVEVHLSNVHARESFRHASYVSPVATGVIMGFGGHSYVLAIEAIAARIEAARG